MRRLTQLHHEQPIPGDRWPIIERFGNAPREWLPQPAEPLRGGCWRAEVRVGPMHRLVTVTLGPLRTLPDAYIRTLDWVPEPRVHPDGVRKAAGIPSLRGQVELRERPDGLHLILEGRYHPPGASVGALLDAVALHRVARRTLAHAARDIASGLQAV